MIVLDTSAGYSFALDTSTGVLSSVAAEHLTAPNGILVRRNTDLRGENWFVDMGLKREGERDKWVARD